MVQFPTTAEEEGEGDCADTVVEPRSNIIIIARGKIIVWRSVHIVCARVREINAKRTERDEVRIRGSKEDSNKSSRERDETKEDERCKDE